MKNLQLILIFAIIINCLTDGIDKCTTGFEQVLKDRYEAMNETHNYQPFFKEICLSKINNDDCSIGDRQVIFVLKFYIKIFLKKYAIWAEEIVLKENLIV